MDRRPTGALGPEGPLAPYELSVPSVNGLGREHEGRPPLPWQHPACSGEQDLVDPAQPGPAGRTPKDLELVAKNEDLDVPVPCARAGGHDAEHGAEDEVQKREQHGARCYLALIDVAIGVSVPLTSRADLYRAAAPDVAGLAVSRLLADFGETAIQPFVEHISRNPELRRVLRAAFCRIC
jgi:hypothetical protein